MVIIRVDKDEHVKEVNTLFKEYEVYIEVDLCFQDFEEELAALPGKYAPPDGVLLLAVEGGEPAGCVALRRLGETSCEMKRLYVRPGFRRKGLGRILAEKVIAEAVRLGYSTMFLDTFEKFREAISLYESLGFEETAIYHDNPFPGVIYWKLELSP